MKTYSHNFFLRISITITFFSLSGKGLATEALFVTDTIISKDTIIRVDADPSQGFYYPYYLRIPKGTKTNVQQFLLVETNNTGNNDTLLFHDKGAYMTAKRNCLAASLCPKLKIPFLVPAFPRPAKDWQIYTHALDRETATIKKGDMKRLDLQLIAMIKHANTVLAKFNITLKKKVFMNGFSASGTFANRFTLIHPEMVAAVAYGGINGIVILPVKSIQSEALNFPLGINDFEKVFGKQIDLSTYKGVPQFAYMGAKDDNDAVKFDDAYSDKERKLIHKILGAEMQPLRWNNCRMIYETNGVSATFKTYPKIGHETDKEVYLDVAAFFQKVINENKN